MASFLGGGDTLMPTGMKRKRSRKEKGEVGAQTPATISPTPPGKIFSKIY